MGVFIYPLSIVIQKPLPLPLPNRRLCCPPFLCVQPRYGANLCEWWIQLRLVVATKIGFQYVSVFLLCNRLVPPSMGLCPQRNPTMANPTNPYTIRSQNKNERQWKHVTPHFMVWSVIDAYFNVSFLFGQFHCFFANLFVFIAHALHIFWCNDTLIDQFFWIDFKAYFLF